MDVYIYHGCNKPILDHSGAEAGAGDKLVGLVECGWVSGTCVFLPPYLVSFLFTNLLYYPTLFCFCLLVVLGSPFAAFLDRGMMEIPRRVY